MTSKGQYKEGYVWIWLPSETTPIIAGKLEADGDTLVFNYGRSYLERIRETPQAIPIYEPELPKSWCAKQFGWIKDARLYP